MDTATLQKSLAGIGDRKLVTEILTHGAMVEIPPRTEILKSGQLIEQIPLVVRGTIKVLKVHGDLREVLLYFIRPGETCVMTLASCLKKERSLVKAITTDDTTLIGIPVNQIYGFMRRFPSWNEFVLHAYRHRFAEIVDAFERRSFHNLEQQILRYLDHLKWSQGSPMLKVTHAEIANDLATSRVVVSRTLKTLERNKLLVLGRNQITLL